MIVARIRYDGVFEGTEDMEAKDGRLPRGYSFSLPPTIPEGHYAILNGSWSIVKGNPPPNPLDEILLNERMANVRKTRNERLASSDWTQVSDAPLTTEQKSQWAAYRQALRNLTQQDGFPNQVKWPEVPQ